MIKKLMLLIMFLFSAVHCSAASYCFVGDSRFVGMQQSISSDDIIWIAEVGATNNFYWENRSYISSLDRDIVIIYELGINDLNTSACIEALQDLESLGFRHIYFTSITPVDDYKAIQCGYTVQNYQIEEFNQTVRNNLPYSVAAMDSYEYLTAMGISTYDGIHYINETYQIWFYNILNSL